MFYYIKHILNAYIYRDKLFKGLHIQALLDPVLLPAALNFSILLICTGLTPNLKFDYNKKAEKRKSR